MTLTFHFHTHWSYSYFTPLHITIRLLSAWTCFLCELMWIYCPSRAVLNLLPRVTWEERGEVLLSLDNRCKLGQSWANPDGRFSIPRMCAFRNWGYPRWGRWKDSLTKFTTKNLQLVSTFQRSSIYFKSCLFLHSTNWLRRAGRWLSRWQSSQRTKELDQRIFWMPRETVTARS